MLCCPPTTPQDYFDQSLDEIKLLRYVNNADPDDEHHIVRLYDFFYYKVRWRGGVQWSCPVLFVPAAEDGVESHCFDSFTTPWVHQTVQGAALKGV